MSPQELVAVVEENGCFSIEKMVDVPPPLVHDTILMPQLIASLLRGIMEEVLKQQFGEEVLDELFDLIREKCEEHASRLDPEKKFNFLVVLRRKAD